MPVDKDQELQRALADTLDELERTMRTRADALSVELVRSARLILAAAAASMGECRQALPYATLRPVLRADGTFGWCCSHPTQHCS